jgi:uncharacterized tellurite resistance protein B-like protein
MAPEPEILRERGRSLEDEFFRREDARLKEKLREAAQREGAREALARATGIKNVKVLERLIDLEVRPETVTALSLVPLVEVAWADGSLDDVERRMILTRADTAGIAPGSSERALLEAWLTRKPDPKLLTAWAQLIRGLCEQMSREDVATLKEGLLGRARAVAGASGGFLGMGSKVSGAEADVIRRLESTFSTGP